MYNTEQTLTHNMDRSVHNNSDTLSDGDENNEHDKHKHVHDGRNLETKSAADEVDMDDPVLWILQLHPVTLHVILDMMTAIL